MKNQMRAGNLQGLRLLVVLIFGALIFDARPAQLNLIPLPAIVTQLPGSFLLNPKTVVVTDTLFTNEAALLQDELHLTQATNISANRILLTTQGADPLGEEAYRLEVDAHGVTIRARTAAGAFYGCQTLRQLIDTTTQEIPFVQIEDVPRYVWRGFMLDVSRNFFDESTLRQLIDWMGEYKLNRLHLHLTDDQAWRLEIDRYPELTQIGARGYYSNGPNHVETNAPVHFFTRAQMAAIIAYAAQRHIIVVPEIDMPGHANAATRTFPQLDGGTNTFNPVRAETYDFLDNVLLATMDIFPSPWIHLGGDEVNRAGWDKNLEIVKKLKADGLTNTIALENYFVNRMVNFTRDHGRTPMGWDEIVGGTPAPGTVIFWWRHNKPESLVQALAGGYSVVLTPRTPCYFDYPQDTNYPTNGWKLFNTPELVYAGPVIPVGVPAAQRKQILGVEGCLWTEHITTIPYLQFMTMPRLAALAEMAWTSDAQRNFAQFNQRLQPFLNQLQQLGIHYYNEKDPQGSLRAAAKPAGNLRSPPANLDGGFSQSMRQPNL